MENSLTTGQILILEPFERKALPANVSSAEPLSA